MGNVATGKLVPRRSVVYLLINPNWQSTWASIARLMLYTDSPIRMIILILIGSVLLLRHELRGRTKPTCFINTAPGISAPPPALGSTANDPTKYLFRPSCNILCRVGVSIIKYKTNYLVSSRVSCTILHVVLYYLLYCCM